ncbi:hypothetical protein Sru01_31910 [Sphaerisporangium rufum]|uniref:PQQ-like domain-containing protein n=1 Tax=Sphaerisporangium rufum TaxID=1381558 RepID=A0A919UZX5_9ACTN|nr:hypothetical protein [Sphaerisporangium rufum]GII78209.1 hypothetical protein Sru01_31910 [Sphaerisporangium rufum]
MKRPKRVLVTVVAAGLLASCGEGPGNEPAASPPEVRTGAAAPAPSPSPSPTGPRTRLSVPSLYDTSRGWESDLPGTQIPLPHSGAVAVFREGGRNDGTFTVLDVTSGKVSWKADLKGPGIVSAFAISVQGVDYLVATASGAEGADVVSKGREITTIDIYAGRATGDDVAPLRHLELDGDGSVGNGGGGLLATFDDDVVMTVDPATGATEKYDLRKMKPPAGECKLCFGSTKAVAVTSRGPLLSVKSGFRHHYWVPGAWRSGTLTTGRPEQTFITPVGDLLVATWRDKGARDDTWAVLDPATAKVRAKVECAADQEAGEIKGFFRSAGGRYLVRGYTAFDLEKGTGHCFEETDRDKPVLLTGVTDDGVAFGTGASTAEQADPRVTVDLATGQVELADYIVAPFGDYSGYGLFWEDSTDTMVAYPRVG